MLAECQQIDMNCVLILSFCRQNLFI